MPAEPKVKFPLDLIPWQLAKLTAAAGHLTTNKKALIFSALKTAHGIDLNNPEPDPNYPDYRQAQK
jgi:hypothetical protein